MGVTPVFDVTSGSVEEDLDPGAGASDEVQEGQI